MVLQILRWPPTRRRRPKTDKEVESDDKAHRTNKIKLQKGRLELPQKTTPGSLALGLRQQKNVATKKTVLAPEDTEFAEKKVEFLAVYLELCPSQTLPSSN